MEDEISINSLLTKIYGNKYGYNFRGAYRRPPCHKAKLRRAPKGALSITNAKFLNAYRRPQ